MAELRNEKTEVTVLHPSPDKTHVAVGYVDGCVEVFDVAARKSVTKFAVHRTAVSCLRYDEAGMKILTGGLDTDVTLLDIVAQTGQCKLSGHRAPVTEALFLEQFENIVVSSSKDTLVKFWDVETQCCFLTLVDSKTEVWSMCVIRETYLVTGSNETTLKVYEIAEKTDQLQLISDDVETENDITSPITCKLVGTIERSGKGRTVSLRTDYLGQVLACHGTDDKIEIFYFRSEEEAKKHFSKKNKKKEGKEGHDLRNVSLSDTVKRLNMVKTGTKIKSMDVLMNQGSDELRIVITSSLNSIKLFSQTIKKKSEEPNNLRSLTKLGHPSDIRAVAFSSNSLLIASASAESLKIWNQESLTCIRTVEIGYSLTCLFVPGDRYVLVGLKTGELSIVDTVSGEVLETISAHEKELWSICLMTDQKGCITAGGDSTVKFWQFELVTEKGQKVLTLTHVNTLKLDESVLSVKVSANGKFLACALLDSTVKIFFVDSLKFYLSLYGHKLPVTCMDISDDSSLIATGSADRNIKIWGMDFGDCHKSIFAHDDSVMGLQFIPKTHMLFTCGKDGSIKQWDGDSFEKIATIANHIGSALNLAVSPNGFLLVTCGTDRVLRLFERTDEILVLHDMQETEREEAENQHLATGEESTVALAPSLKLASKKTIGSEKGAESILECLEICRDLEAAEKEHVAQEKHPLMLALNVDNSDDFLLATLSNIRPSDLEESLLLLPFTAVCDIIQRVYKLAKLRQDQTELICKVVVFLFRIHQKPIANNHVMYKDVRRMIRELQSVLTEFRDMVGRNYHALQMVRREIEANEEVRLFQDVSKKVKTRNKNKNQKLAMKRALAIRS